MLALAWRCCWRGEQHFQQASQPLREAAIAGMNLKRGGGAGVAPPPPREPFCSQDRRRLRGAAETEERGISRSLGKAAARLSCHSNCSHLLVGQESSASAAGRAAVRGVRRRTRSHLLHFAAPAIATVAAHSHDFCTAIQSLQPGPRLVPSGRARIAGFPGKGLCQGRGFSLPRVPCFLLGVYIM